MYVQPKYLLFLCFLSISVSLNAMLFDNRFFFILRQPITRYECQVANLATQVFVMTADRAFDEFKREMRIPTLYGLYDQAVIAKALVDAGITETSLLPPDLRTRTSIPWDIDAKIEAQGIAFRSSYRFQDYFEIGAGIYAIHARQGYEFMLANEREFSAGEQQELFISNTQIKEALGLVPAQWNETSIGDAYVYARIGNIWEYTAKFHRIDAGAFVGIMTPWAQERNIFNPASLPLGGNGHTGVFAGVDAQFELKEDLVVGFELTFLKRLARTRIERLPFFASPITPTQSSPSDANKQQNTTQKDQTKNEPQKQSEAAVASKAPATEEMKKAAEAQLGSQAQDKKETATDTKKENKPEVKQEKQVPWGEPLNYGAIVTPAFVDPGLTVHFAPYIALERLRDGFGIRLGAHFIKHFADNFSTTIPANLAFARQLSRWRAGIVSVNLVYDFGYHKENRDGSPILSLAWDAPVEALLSKRVSKTHIISLTLEVGF